MEEDLSKIIGDAPAHLLMQACTTVTQALQQFVGKRAASAAARGKAL
jgi:ubiquinone biosynthesis protein UbiJ